ncbi:MAG: carboxypeptidase regulatory-like domain-containing protein, partial [Thermoplasmata archaeon]
MMYEIFMEVYPALVASLPEEALKAMDNYTMTVSVKNIGLEPSTSISDTTVKPFSMRIVNQTLNEDPSAIYGIMKAHQDCFLEILELPRVAVLRNGFWSESGWLLTNIGEPVTFVDVNCELDRLVCHPVLIIPSGGLYGLDGSRSFKSKLEDYLEAGGTIIALAQQYGNDYGALPGNLKGYGWIEDQSCQYASVGITTYMPFLAGQSGPSPSINVDGYFTSWPESATVVLSRTKNAQPAMLAYEWGRGRVVVLSAYEDWAHSHNALSADGKRLIQDLVAWAVDPAPLTEAAPGSSASVEVPLKNRGPVAASKVSITTVSPDRAIVASLEQSVSLSPGSSTTLNLSLTAPSTPGIWWLDYNLKDSSGKVVSQGFDAQRLAVSMYRANPRGFLYNFSGMFFDITSDKEHVPRGSSVNFTIHIRSYLSTDQNVTVKYDWSHVVFDERRVAVPAGGSIDLVYERKNADTGRFWAWFYDESGRQLGVASKGIWGFTPSIKVSVSADRGGYAEGEGIKVTVSVSSPSALGIASLTLSALDPVGNSAASESREVELYGAPATETFTLSLPRTALSGSYLLVARAEALVDTGMGSARVNYTGGEGRVSGRLADWLTNGSIPGATITFEALGEVRSATTDADGSYSLELRGAYYKVVTKAQGYNSARVMIPVYAYTNNTRDIYTTAGGAGALNIGRQGIEGRVLTLLSEKGVGGASVLVNLSANEIFVDTEDDGRYSILLPPGKYRVMAELGGSQSAPTEAIVCSGRMTTLDLYLDADLQSGTVLDIVYRTPIPGASLVFDGGPAVLTDGSGRYTVALAVGHHSVSVSAGGYAGLETGIYVAQRTSDLDFFLFPTTNWTTGVIRNLVDESPISRAMVSFDGVVNATTDSEGRYRALLGTGHHSVEVSAEGYESVRTGVHVAARSSDMDFYLKPMGEEISGTVRDLVYGFPLAGVALSFDGTSNTTTGPDGGYAIALSVGYHSVSLALEGYEGISTGVHVAKRSSGYDFFLKPLTRPIAGVVLDLIYEFPIPNVRVSIDSTHNTTTGPDGRFSMTVSTGYHNVELVNPSYSPLTTGIHVAANSSDYVFYLTPPSFNLSYANGTVRDLVTGAPIGGVELTFDGSLTATTDAGGRYSKNLGTGYHTVSLSKTGYDPLTTGIHLAGRASELDFYLEPNAFTVSGTVKDLNETAGLPGASVVFDGSTSATTDGNGGFTVTLSRGLHDVEISKTGYDTLVTTVLVTARSPPLYFRLTPQGYTPPVTTGNLTGRVYDLVSGQPVEGITIWYDDWDRVTTNETGFYSFQYRAGVCRLIVRGTDDYDGLDSLGHTGWVISVAFSPDGRA